MTRIYKMLSKKTPQKILNIPLCFQGKQISIIHRSGKNVCNRCIVQIVFLKIVLYIGWKGVDFAETSVRHDIFFVTEKVY